MKKNILIILCIITIAALAGTCGYLFLNNQKMQGALKASQENSSRQTQEISNLNEELSSKEEYILGQAGYVEELTRQLEELEAFNSQASEEEKNKDNTGKTASYQKKYPDLYAQEEYEKRQRQDGADKTVYLTFDDGPSDLTPEVLDLLDKYHAKATFFVVYKDEKKYTEYLSEIVDRGHTLALHSYSHDYKKIYASVDAFLSDFEKVYNWVYEETGQRPTLFRFPGGSNNGKKAITDEIVTEMQRRGFIYYDWNVSSGDGSNETTSENIIENICTNVKNFDFPVVLMHDAHGKRATLNALPDVLSYLKEKGYAFESLEPSMPPVQYKRH